MMVSVRDSTLETKTVIRHKAHTHGRADSVVFRAKMLYQTSENDEIGCNERSRSNDSGANSVEMIRGLEMRFRGELTG